MRRYRAKAPHHRPTLGKIRIKMSIHSAKLMLPSLAFPRSKGDSMAAKATSNPKRAPKSGGDVIFTGTAIVITLDAAAQRQAKRCMAKNGKITFSIKEHSVTQLPQILDNGKLID